MHSHLHRTELLKIVIQSIDSRLLKQADKHAKVLHISHIIFDV